MTETGSNLLDMLEGMERIARQCYVEIITPLNSIQSDSILTLAESELIHFERSGYTDGEKLAVGLQIVAAVCGHWVMPMWWLRVW